MSGKSRAWPLIKASGEKRLPLFAIENGSVARLQENSFHLLSIRERDHLQKWIRNDISVIGDGMMVIAEEFSQWEEGSRRIDLLCLDGDGSIVVVEIKRTEDGGHMELQALRYAAMVSAMTFDQLVAAHAKFLGGSEQHQAAEAAILTFLGHETISEASLPGKVRIVLVSQNFSREITTSVLWLNASGLDIRCIRMTPYKYADQLFLDVQPIIPLPEAADYELKIKAQKNENERAESARHGMRRRFWNTLIPMAAAKAGLFSNRSAPTVHWIHMNLQPGIKLGFVILKDVSRVEIYIDLGAGSGEATRAAFDFLLSRKQSIEGALGAALDWDPLEEGRACRISQDIKGGWGSPETEWLEVQGRMVDALSRLKEAIEPSLVELSLVKAAFK